MNIIKQILSWISGAILLVGCNAERRFNDYSIKHPDKFKTLAAVIAPCSDEITKSDTLYQTKTDTLIQDGISDTVRINDTVRITKTLAGKVITKTEVRTVTNTVPDTRALDACEIKTRTAENKALENETKQILTQRMLNWWRGAFFALLGLVIGWSFLSKYLGGVFGWLKGGNGE